MKRFIVTTLALAGVGLIACQSPEESPAESQPTTEEAPSPETEWIVLFDGHDLSSFEQVGGANWTIVDDYVEATSGEPGFLVTKDIYGDVEVSAEFWTNPEANSGIFMRCEDASDIGSRTCYEVNIFDQRPDQTYRTGAIVNIAEPMAQLDAADQWNTFDIVMEGEHLTVTMNDTLMVDTDNAEHARGHIALQWSAGTVRFRNVRVKPL
jgi:hypothetical protein